MTKEIARKTYELHLEEIKSGLTEYYKHRNEVDLEWRHKIGLLLNEYAEVHNISLKKHICAVAQDLHREERTIYYMAQFAKKFPLLSSAPLEKPWRDICHEDLDNRKKVECEHEFETIKRCKKCKIWKENQQ